jgi:hypothetical protein
MDRSWYVNGGICAVAFTGCMLLLVPSTEIKASWSSIRHEVTPYVPGPAADTTPDYTYPVAALPPERDQQAWREPAEDDEATRQEIAIAEADRAYGDGYAWAADQEVESSRECRRLRGSREEGCRDYVASLPPEEDPEEPLSAN